MAARNLSVLSRQFSTSSSRHAIVKTPIPVYGIEGRYSAALYSAANKKKALDAVEADLKKLQGAMKSDKRSYGFSILTRTTIALFSHPEIGRAHV